MADTATDWRVAGVSVPGTSHLRAGIPCQDMHQHAHLPGGILIVGVADGAGSAPHADLGSACAVRAAIQAAMDLLSNGLPQTEADWLLLLRDARQAAREALSAEAAAHGSPLAHLATTLLLTVASPELVAAGQVGDGAVVARLADAGFQAVTRPPAQEFLDETTFLTAVDPFQQAQFRVLNGPLTELALFSDGLQMLALKMPEGLPHPPFFEPLFRFVAQTRDLAVAEDQLRSFLQSTRITDRADDDLTLVLAVCDAR